jgi:putative oxidoreductase
MSIVRRIARPLLASVFVQGGIDTLRNPGPRAAKAEKLDLTSTRLATALNMTEDEQVVRANAGLQVLGGLALATNNMPRLASAGLAASLVPTTAAGHRFWEESHPASRKAQQQHFVKNLAILGGLMIAAVDTEGRDSLPRRARHKAKAAGRVTEKAGLKAELATERARRKAGVATVKATGRAAAKAARAAKGSRAKTSKAAKAAKVKAA